MLLNSEVRITKLITVDGDQGDDTVTKLILCDGAKLIAEKGIYVGNGKGLYIYGQSKNSMGFLEAEGGDNQAGIGGNGSRENSDGGTIVIYGGNITAAGSGNGTYVVKQGDCLSKIAEIVNKPVKYLAEKNGIKDVDKLAVGQMLKY